MRMALLFFLLLVLSTPVFALSYRAQCIGNGGRVAVAIYTSQDKIFMRYSNSLGSADFPFYEGLVTKNSMPFIKIAEKELSSIDHEAIVSWPVEKCKFNEETPLLMSCDGAATFIQPEKSKLESYTLITSMTKESALSYSYDIFKIRWGIEGEDFHHSILMPFDPNNCQVDYNK